MSAIINTVAISCAIVVVLYAWKVVNLLWLKPKKLEKLLRQQGFKGNNYRFLFGDTKVLTSMFTQARAKPINLDDVDGVVARVMPFHHHALQKYGKNFIIWLGWHPRVHIMDPELIKDVFLKINDFRKPDSNPLVKLLATGLVSYEGEQWAKHRKLLNPSFHMEKLKNMLPAFGLSCSEMIRKWETEISSNGSCELDVWPHLQALTSDVLSRTSFGSNYEEGKQIFELISELCEHTIHAVQSVYIPGLRFLPTKRNRRMKQIDKEVQLSLRSIIDKRLKAIKSVGEDHNDDLLGIMLQSSMKEIEDHGDKSHGLTMREVIEECKIFYFAGQETTSSLLVWTMILLSKHQEWQSRAREEILNVFGSKNIDADGLNRLKVVSMILYEVLRLYPPVTGLARITHEDITLGGLSVPSGVEIGLPMMLLHYDEEIWGDDVKEFKPDRFCEGVSKATKNQAAFSPFGGGPRICIGQNFALLESKMALAMILQSFSFEFSPSYVHAPHTVLILQPQYGAHLILHKL